MKRILLLFALLVPAQALALKCETITGPAATAVTISFCPDSYDSSATNDNEKLEFAAPTWAAGDAKISKDGGAIANTASLPTNVTGACSRQALTATEMTASTVVLNYVDQTTPKAFGDQCVVIYTYETSAGSGFHSMASVDVDTIEGTAAKAAINAEADTALADYDAPTKAELDTGFAALNDITPAQVNAEVLDVLDTDTHAELSACPTNPASLRTMIQFTYQWFLHKKDKDSSTEIEQLYKDDGTTALCKRPYGVTGTVSELGEYVTP